MGPPPMFAIVTFRRDDRAYSRSIPRLISGGPSIIVKVKAFGIIDSSLPDAPHLDSL